MPLRRSATVAQPSGSFSGHMQELAPGILVTNMSTSTSHTGMTDLDVTMRIDPVRAATTSPGGAVDNLIKGLAELIRGTHPSQQAGFGMTSSSVAFVHLDEVVEEVERDPEIPQEEITLVTLKELIEERFDGLDSAIRLAIGE